MQNHFSPRLNALAAEEEALMKIVRDTYASIFDKIALLDKMGVFQRYDIVYRAYVDLAFNGDESERMEALKRALFVQWFAIADPAFITGIPGGNNPFGNSGDLDWATQIAILKRVQTIILGAEPDYELHWMIDWYYKITDYYFEFEKFTSTAPLAAYLKSIEPIKHWIVTGLNLPDLESLVGRGQMSDYFVSMRQKYP